MPDQKHACYQAEDVFRFGLAHGEGEVIVSLDGELDAMSVAEGWLALELAAAAGQARVIVDCGGLEFVDAAGLRFLVAARARVLASGGDLVLDSPPPVIRRILDITGGQALISAPRPGGLGPSRSLPYDLGSTYQAAVAAALRISGATMGNLQLADAASGELRIVAQHGFRKPFLRFFASVRDTNSACGTAMHQGTPVWVNDVATSPIFAGTAARDVMLDAGSRAVASLPVRAPDGRVIAMISAHHDHPAAWPKVPRFQLEQLAQLTGRLVARQSSVH